MKKIIILFLFCFFPFSYVFACPTELSITGITGTSDWIFHMEGGESSVQMTAFWPNNWIVNSSSCPLDWSCGIGTGSGPTISSPWDWTVNMTTVGDDYTLPYIYASGSQCTYGALYNVSPTPTFTPTPSPTPTLTPTSTPTPTNTPIPTPTNTLMPTPTKTPTQTPTTQPSSSSNTSSSSSPNTASAPVCNDTKPGSAPVLLSAIAGTNSVTLTWSEATTPVSYYLVTYGNEPGAQQYGNPNVGGKGTTSYTVSELSGGSTYYFRIRAGNGCKPGDYSNELSATPGGIFYEGPAAEFEEGVLGATDIITPTIAPTVTQAPEKSDVVVEDKTSERTYNPWWFYLSGFGGAVVYTLSQIFLIIF